MNMPSLAVSWQARVGARRPLGQLIDLVQMGVVRQDWHSVRMTRVFAGTLKDATQVQSTFSRLGTKFIKP